MHLSKLLHTHTTAYLCKTCREFGGWVGGWGSVYERGREQEERIAKEYFMLASEDKTRHKNNFDASLESSWFWLAQQIVELYTVQHPCWRRGNMTRWFTSPDHHLLLSSCVTAQHRVCHIHQSHNLQQKGNLADRFTPERWAMLIIGNTLIGWHESYPTNTIWKSTFPFCHLNEPMKCTDDADDVRSPVNTLVEESKWKMCAIFKRSYCTRWSLSNVVLIL